MSVDKKNVAYAVVRLKELDPFTADVSIVEPDERQVRKLAPLIN